jgi:hypothetical protein
VRLELSEIEFWQTAWRVRGELERPTGSASTLSLIADDFVLQAYLFDHSQFRDASRFEQLVDAGVFDSPPAVRVVPKGVVAQPWPALSYLRSIATERPKEVARILGRIDSDNWWVVAQSLDIAASLEQGRHLRELARLLTLWAKAPARWTGAKTLSSALLAFAKRGRSEAQFRPLTAQVLVQLLFESHSAYEIGALLGDLEEQLPKQRTESLVGALEDALSAYDVIGDLRTSSLGTERLGVSWRDDDAITVVVNAWVRLSDQLFTKSTSGNSVRAARLLGMRSSLFRRMGLHTLSGAISSDGNDVLANGLLRQVVKDDELFSWQYNLELGDLLTSHFSKLPQLDMKAFVDKLSQLAVSDERYDRHKANRLLHQVLGFVGPAERELAQALEGELGAPAEIDEGVEAHFVAVESGISTGELDAMEVDDVVAWTRFLPVEASSIGWRRQTSEGFANALTLDLQREPGKYESRLVELIEAARYEPIVTGVLNALRELAKQDGRGFSVGELVAALTAALDRADTLNFIDEPDAATYGASGIRGSVADVIQASTTALLEAPASSLRELLARVMADSDPTPEHEARFGGANMDPFTLAINSTRGKGLRATLDLWAALPGDPAESEQLGMLNDLIAQMASSEHSPSVRSCFGIYLPWLVERWPQGSDALGLLLPANDEEKAKWEAVFTTYLLFRPAFLSVADALRDHYELAVARLEDDTLTYLAATAGRLIVHLASLSLANDNDLYWGSLLRRALDVTPDERSAEGLGEMANGLQRGTVDVAPRWIFDLVESRVSVLDGETAPGHMELTSLFELVITADADLANAGPHAVALLRRGARPNVDDVVAYLDRKDTPGSSLGAQLLVETVSSAIRTDPWFVDERVLLAEIQRYSEAGRTWEMWRLVNLLGASYRFFVEEVARSIAPAATVTP